LRKIGSSSAENDGRVRGVSIGVISVFDISGAIAADPAAAPLATV